MNKQRGHFKIPRDLIDENPMVVLAVMAKVIVIRAEYILMNDTVKYDAISPEFRFVPDREVTPYYEIIVETINDDDGYFLEHKIVFNEVENNGIY